MFRVDRSVITKHLKNIFATKELFQDSVCAKIAHTAEDGKTYKTNFYSLDAIIAVGYRVNSKQATQFRIWAIATFKFLESNSLDVLPNAGNISHDQAVEKAHAEYEQFRIEQDKKYMSDLDKEMKKMSKS